MMIHFLCAKSLMKKKNKNKLIKKIGRITWVSQITHENKTKNIDSKLISNWMHSIEMATGENWRFDIKNSNSIGNGAFSTFPDSRIIFIISIFQCSNSPQNVNWIGRSDGGSIMIYLLCNFFFIMGIGKSTFHLSKSNHRSKWIIYLGRWRSHTHTHKLHSIATIQFVLIYSLNYLTIVFVWWLCVCVCARVNAIVIAKCFIMR